MIQNGFAALRRFYSGRFYPLLVTLLIFAGHSTGYDLIFGTVIILSLMLGCFLCDDLRFALLPFCSLIFLVTVEHSPNVPDYSRYYLQIPILIWLIVLAVGLIGSLIWFAIRNRCRAKRLPRGGMFGGMAVFCAALCLNGAFSVNYTVANLFYVSSFLLSLLGVYALFSAYVRFNETSFDYFLYCLVLSGLLISAELVLVYFTTVRFADGSIVKESVLLGWGVWTAIGGMLAFLMPACFYFAGKHRRGWIGYLLGLAEMVCILLSQSRGALVVGGVILVLCLLLLCLRGEYRKRNRWMTVGVICAGICFAGIFSDKLLALLQNFNAYGFGDNGRFDLWKTGIRHFLENPFFGSGFYDSFVNESWKKDVYPYLYHNTVVQMLGAAGTVGFIGYAWHRFCTVRLVLKNPNPVKSYLGLCIAGLLLFSLLDVLFFNTYPTVIYSLMLVFMDRSEKE